MTSHRSWLLKSVALNVMSFTFDGGRIAGIGVVRNPKKLSHITLSA